MAKKISAKKIGEALLKVQRVGEVEEDFTLDGRRLVLKSLRPEEYQDAATESQEFEDLAYITAYKKEHICRSLIEIEGESLRDVAFVDVEVEENGVEKTITVERHHFIRDYVLSSWSREAIDVAFKKFNDVVAKADAAAANGVTFTVPDETPEEKFRRMLTEAKELQGQMPFELANRIMAEVGFAQKATKEEELVEVDRKLSKLAADTAEKPASPPPAPPAPPAPPVPLPPLATPGYQLAQQTAQQTAQPPTPPPVQPPPAPPAAPQGTQERVPLNQMAIGAPVVPDSPAARPMVPLQHPGGNVSLPVQGAFAAQHPTQRVQQVLAPPGGSNRAREIAALEGLDIGGIQGGSSIVDAVPASAIGQDVRPTPQVDPTKVEPVFEQPPTAGINARFRRRQ